MYDALAHERVYKKAWPEARVLEYFDGQRDRQFEGTLVSALLRSADALRDIREGMPDDGTEPRSYPPQVRA